MRRVSIEMQHFPENGLAATDTIWVFRRLAAVRELEPVLRLMCLGDSGIMPQVRHATS